ncbi:hypothetical protein PTKIN_Ptkin17bG0056900 [Pterospermum kingtungense]
MTNQEELKIVLDEEDESNWALTGFVVVGLILTDKALHRKGVLGILRGIWSEKFMPCIREVHDLPLELMTEKNAATIGEKIGSDDVVKVVDGKGEGQISGLDAEIDAAIERGCSMLDESIQLNIEGLAKDLGINLSSVESVMSNVGADEVGAERGNEDQQKASCSYIMELPSDEEREGRTIQALLQKMDVGFVLVVQKVALQDGNIGREIVVTRNVVEGNKGV